MNSRYPNNNNSSSCLNRKEFIHQILAGLGGMAFYSCMGKDRKSLPNIVMIISDDQGWGDYGFMGNKIIQTPNLDRLAASSRVFTRGYVTAPLCGPSLASIITGLHPHQHGKTSNDPPQKGEMMDSNTRGWSKERRQLREQVISNFSKHPAIPKELKELGYSSLQTGKWWMGNYRTGGFTHGMTHGDMDRGGRHGDEGLKIGRETMQPLYDFIDESNEHPFFIWYAPFLPHTPHNPPERLLSKYRDKTESIHVARYWANCEWFDETCGELLGYLDEKGISDNTIVLYVCDNGWIQQPDKGSYAERSKRSPHEGGIRTPIMIKWPGHVTPGFDETTLVSSIDFAPTVLNACGLTPTADMQGVDLLDRQSLKKRDAIFGVAYTHDAVDINNPAASIRYSYVLEGEWKLILPSGRNDTGTEPELYHVSEDPHEKINLAGSNPEKVKHMKQLLKEWWSKTVD
jgi:arylsulfatase A-like enzyme